MTRTVTGALAAAALVLPLAAPATAEETGTLTLEIGEESVPYMLWAEQSDWSGSEGFGSASIFARPAADTDAYDSFSLGFSFSAAGAQDGEARLRAVENGETTVYFAGADDADGGLTVTIDSLSVTGEELTVSGSFDTRMGPSEDYGRTIDLGSPLAVGGSFEVTLGPVE